MQAVHAGAYPSGHSAPFIERLNAEWHEVALRTFMVIVLAHWAEHLTQAFQIYALGWPVPASRGLLGQFFPWLVKSETLHYGYALVMLVGLFAAAEGLHGRQGAPVVDDRARRSSSSTTSSTGCCRFRPSPDTISSIARCPRASFSSGSRASNCTSSTTPSSSSRW